MGALTKKPPPVIVPTMPAAAATPAPEAAALPPPAPQDSPTAQRGNAASKGPAALAAGLGMNNTILTGPRGLPGLPTETRRSSLLGL